MAAPVRFAGPALVLALSVGGLTSAATPKEIDAAIKKGADYLRKEYREPRGNNPGGETGIGETALAGWAMLEAGVPGDDPAVKAVTAAVREAAYTQSRTYHIVLCMIYLDRYGEPADVPLIQVLAVRLLTGQTAQGGWTYNCTPDVPAADAQRLRASLRPVTPPAPGAPTPMHPEVLAYARTLAAQGRAGMGDDNSNTQFGVLGVWVARRHGVPVEPALDLIEKRFLATQHPQSGGWPYAGDGVGSPSMTCAGLLGLATGVARREERRMKAEAPKKADSKPGGKSGKAADPFFNPPPRPEGDTPRKAGPARPLDARDLAIQRGFASVGAALVEIARNPELRGKGLLENLPGSHGLRDLYFFWSVERVAMLFNVDKFGGIDWYQLGADGLVPSQAADGSWTSGGYSTHVNTAFAILFLTKANVARDMSSRIRGETSELRAGASATPVEGSSAGPTPKSPTPDVPRVNPLPLPVEDESGRLAAGLLVASGPDWAKALEKLRDAKGGDYTRAIVLAIHRLDGDQKKQARDALAERLTRMTADTLRGMLKAEDAELRRGATLACAMKDDKVHVPDLIDRLTDDEELVVRAAKAGLKSLTNQDLGPAAGATKAQRQAAATAWRQWWDKQKK
jgi:hypothetical protein